MPSKHMPGDTGLPSAKWYQHITELPLSRFIDCTVDDNLYALVISGHPSQEQLQLTWAEMQQEYADVMGDNEHKMYVILYRDIKVLEITLQLIHWLVAQMKEVYYAEFANRLNRLLNTTFKFDHTQPEKYFNELNRCINRSKAYKIDLDLKLQQFEAFKKNKETGSKPTREYYQSILITLSDHAKYPVQDNITVYEFSERIRRFSKYCQQVEKMKR
jgi:hypothetical protein